MSDLSTFITALTLGLLGSAHCIGMCGGITSALSLSIQGKSRFQVFGLMLLYHCGRLLSYALAGFLLAGIGWFLGDLSPWAKMALRYFAGLMMIAMGLYLTGWWRGLTYFERAGQQLWRYIQPIASKLLPIKSPGNALILGILWGWLPCGLVYSNLVWTASQGSPITGALAMFCFGLGTLPAVFLMGAFSRQLSQLIQASFTRNIAGIMVILFGIWAIPGPHQKWLMSLIAHH